MLGTAFCLSNVVQAEHPSLLDRLFGFDKSVATSSAQEPFTLTTPVNVNSPPAAFPIFNDRQGQTTNDMALYSPSLVAARSHVERGWALLAQNHPAAECEFMRALICIAKLRNVEQNSHLFSQSLANGIAALWEADELYQALATSDVETALQIAQDFTTPVGRALQSGQLAAAEATDTYLAYARQSIVVAVGKHRLSTEALQGLGRTYALAGGQSDALASHRQQKSKALLLAAQAAEVNRPQRTSPAGPVSSGTAQRSRFVSGQEDTGSRAARYAHSGLFRKADFARLTLREPAQGVGCAVADKSG